MDLYLSVAPDLKTWSPDLTGLRPFVALLALDTKAEEDETLERLASHLMAAGCYYVCTWGPGCSWLHDVVDHVWIRENPESAALPADVWDETCVMTTWHDDKRLVGLDEALWEVIFTSFSDEHDLRSLVAVVSPPYVEHVERRLADSVGLSRDVVGDEP
jgi:hypothetical protein